uniref:Uncharacterized protein n=1 Tax=Knipowitschia caucasica TaxID=637954 RepID=A0AAV2MNG5_KNICA
MQVDGKAVDGSLLGDANGVEPAPGRGKESGKWQKPRFSRKALMKCCLVKWIIASTQPQDKVTRLHADGVVGIDQLCLGSSVILVLVESVGTMNACRTRCAKVVRCVIGFITGTLIPGTAAMLK